MLHQNNKKSFEQSDPAELSALDLLPMALARFAVDLSSPYPMYEQVCQCVRTAIAAGDLPAGSRLPPARVLADRLGVARNTIVTAYGRLAAEGYVTANTRRGTRVTEGPVPPLLQLSDISAEEKPKAVWNTPEAHISLHARHWLQTTNDAASIAAGNVIGSPDPFLCPRVSLARLLTEEFSKPVPDDAAATQHFQGAVSSLMLQMRGIRCVPEQIIPVATCRQGMELVARLMIDPGDGVYVEDPIDPWVRQSLESVGAQLVHVPCDNQGADIAKASGPRPGLIVVSPSASFGYGRQMADARRRSVIQFAANCGATVLEWDRCWGLSYTGGRNPAIRSQAPEGTVIYMDSFFEILGVHLRIGFVIVPRSMVEPFTRLSEQAAAPPASFLLTALGRFIEGHQYNVHLSNVRTTYARRLRRLSELCRASLANVAVIEPNAGYTLVIEFPDQLNDIEVCRRAGGGYIPLAPLSRLFSGATGIRSTGIVIGASAMSERSVEVVVRQLGGAIRQMRASQNHESSERIATGVLAS